MKEARVDKLGRIVIPIEHRKALGLKENAIEDKERTNRLSSEMLSLFFW